MQTFLPYRSFERSAAVLDWRRLGKQRSETMQIMGALLVPGRGWSSHPATNMWRGYHLALFAYQEAVIFEWLGRGYVDTCLDKTWNMLSTDDQVRYEDGSVPLEMPTWLGNTKFHRAHQSNLVRKDREHYGPLFPGVPDDLEYVWPS